jgi:hypothetical protein
MRVNNEIWKQLKEQIEHFTNSDDNITDVTINYQVKQSAERNFLKLSVKQ